MNDTIITVEHLSRKYRLGQIGATTLRERARALRRIEPRRHGDTERRLQELRSSAIPATVNEERNDD